MSDGRLPVVLGGDCTLTLGVVVGIQRRQPDVGMVYFDGDADLATPELRSLGVPYPATATPWPVR